MTSSSPLSSADVPRQIGPYQILEPIGEGGMGVVFTARPIEGGETVALKTVLLHDATRVQGMRREIHALARLRHPGVVRILGEGLYQGRPWYAMELIDGAPLTAKCPSAPITTDPLPAKPSGSIRAITRWVKREDIRKPAADGQLDEVLRIVRGLCAPLAFLHGEGLVHRDLKPENILLRADGSPVIMDLGLTQSFERKDVSRDTLDQAVDVGGTAAYMAPEQIRGEMIDARADLYALGCILFRLVTGRTPFVGPNAISLVYQHTHLEPPKASTIARGVPEALDNLIAGLLAKKPRDRIGHAASVARSLDALAEAQAELRSWDPETVDAGPTPRPYLYRPELAGRRAVFESISDALDEVRAGRGGVVLLGGESGVGKTRLALEIASTARATGIRVLTGVSQRAGVPLHPLRAAFQWICDRVGPNGLEVADRLLGPRGRRLAPYHAALGRLPGMEDYAPPAALPPEVALELLYSDLEVTFEAIGREVPLVLILDDLQWADELTTGWLDRLARERRLSNLPVLILGTYRVEEHTDRLGLIAAREGVEHHLLEALDAAAVTEIVGDMLALAEPPGELVELMLRRSGGNPLFVAEYLRAGLEAGLLAMDAQGRWQLHDVADNADAEASDGYQQITLPRTLVQLVGRRLDHLDDLAARLVRIAAIVGTEAAEIDLASLADLDGVERLEAVEQVLARRILEEPAPGRLRFAHDQLRDRAYELIEPDARPTLHLQVARFLAAEPDAEPAQLAHHYEAGGERALARSAYLAAARQATARYALDEAERLYRRVLTLGDPDAPGDDEVAAANELARRVLWVLGRNRDAIALHEQAGAMARASGSAEGEARALLGLSTLHRITGDVDRALELGEQARERFSSAGSRGAVGESLTVLAAARLARGELAASAELFEQALTIHRELDNRMLEAIVLSNLGVIRHTQGQPEAEQLQAQALAIHRAIGNRRSEGITLENIATIRRDGGRYAEAREAYAESLEVLREVGDRAYEAIAVAGLAGLDDLEGRTEDARAGFERALALLEAVGDRASRAAALRDLAALDRRTGSLDDARRHLETASEIDAEHPDTLARARGVIERGHLELAHGRSAASLLTEAAGLLGEAGPDSPLGRRLAALLHAQQAFASGAALTRGEVAPDA